MEWGLWTDGFRKPSNLTVSVFVAEHDNLLLSNLAGAFMGELSAS